MAKIECWANIPDEQERKAVMAWVRASNFSGYSEIGEKVSVTYEDTPDDPDNDSKRWGVIHFFEQYPEHGIYGHDL